MTEIFATISTVRERQEKMEFAKGKYRVIYADPPWQYRNKKMGGSMISGSACKYPVMPLSEIKQLPIAEIADRDCVLFLWVTTPLLPDGIELIRQWGFRYKTAIFWRKIMSMGMGFWYRGQVEVLLVGVKGKVRAFRIQKANFIQSKAGRHSEKPQEARELIEMTGLGPKIELFATQRFPGWDAWGNEVNNQQSISNNQLKAEV